VVSTKKKKKKESEQKPILNGTVEKLPPSKIAKS
jgi:hypothetical protein